MGKNTIKAAGTPATVSAELLAFQQKMKTNLVSIPFTPGEYDVTVDCQEDLVKFCLNIKLKAGNMTKNYIGIEPDSKQLAVMSDQLAKTKGIVTFDGDDWVALKKAHIWVEASTYLSEKTGLPTDGVNVNFCAPKAKPVIVTNTAPAPF